MGNHTTGVWFSDTALKCCSIVPTPQGCGYPQWDQKLIFFKFRHQLTRIFLTGLQCISTIGFTCMFVYNYSKIMQLRGLRNIIWCPERRIAREEVHFL